MKKRNDGQMSEKDFESNQDQEKTLSPRPRTRKWDERYVCMYDRSQRAKES